MIFVGNIMKNLLKKILYRFPILFNLAYKIQNLPSKDVFCKRLKINSIGGGYVKLSKYIVGSNNYLEIGKDSHLSDTRIHIVGNNNKLIFGDNCRVGKNCSFWMEGNNIEIVVGECTTFTHTVHFCAQEDNMTIRIGKDCMFSNTIVVRTSDSHPIFDSNCVRINPAKSITIGEHVWIAPNSKIMKGVAIGDGCIIGSDTMVTKDLPNNVLAVGHPARIVKTNIHWTRERLF